MGKYEVNTKSDLKYEMKKAGSHFFDRDTIHFFGSILHSVYGVPGGAVFVTSEKPPHGPREYKARYWDNGQKDTRSVKSPFLFKEDATDEAKKIAKRLRAGADAHALFSEPY